MQLGKATALVAISLFVMTACTRQAPSTLDTAADEAALRAADETVARAHSKGDLEALVALYAEDAILMPAGAPEVKGATPYANGKRRHWQIGSRAKL